MLELRVARSSIIKMKLTNDKDEGHVSQNDVRSFKGEFINFGSLSHVCVRACVCVCMCV